MLTFKLKMAASTLSAMMLRISGISVFQDGNIIDLGVSQLQVVDACSGLRYLMPLFLLSLLIGHFFSKGLWRRIILLLLSVPISLFLNAFRVWLTGLLIIKGYTELAESLFHDFMGWLIFMIASVLLFLATLFLKKIGSHHTNKPKVDAGSQTSGILQPLILSGFICLMFLFSGWALKEIPYAGNLPQRTVFKSFPMQIGEWQGKRNYLTREILDQLWADDYVSAIFTDSNSRYAIYLFIPFYEYQGTRHTAHAPQACLLGGGFALLNQQERQVNLNNGNQIKVMTMTLVKGNAKILGSYFFLQRGRVITSPWMNKFHLMWDAFKKRRTDGALVRTEMLLAPGQSVEEAYPILEDFIAKLWEILPEYVPD
jgi:exosortase D (VPLPA-CTERM-specific)